MWPTTSKSATNVDPGKFAAVERNHHAGIVPALEYNASGLVKAKSAIKQRSCMSAIFLTMRGDT